MLEITRNIKELEGNDWRFKRSVKAYNHLQQYGNTLDECYNRCSREKELIYNKCFDEVHTIANNYNLEIDYSRLGIATYNIFQFTFQALLMNKKYYVIIYITKEHNYFDIRER